LCIGSINFGSRKKKALKKRWRSVERDRRRTMGESVEDEDDEDEEDEEDDEDKEGANDEEEEDKDKVEVAVERESEHGDEEMGDGVQSDREMRDAGEDEDGGGEYGASWEGEERSTHLVHGEDDGGAADADGGEHVEEGDEASEHVANNDDDKDQPDDFSEASSLDIPGNIDSDATDETSSIDSYEEARSYDPVKLRKEDVKWIGRSRALAINKEWKGNKKVFLSGRGRYDDYVSPVRRAGSYRVTKYPFLVPV
jgi:hypothetical protein